MYQWIENDQSKSNQTEINSLIGSILTPGIVRKKADRIDEFDENLWAFKPIYGDIQRQYFKVIAEYIEARMSGSEYEFKFFTKFSTL